MLTDLCQDSVAVVYQVYISEALAI